MRHLFGLSLVLTFTAPSLAHATPGPDTVVVIANANVPESVALAERYAAARGVPTSQVCLLDVADVEDIDLAEYEATLLEPLRACLDRTSGVRARIEAALLVRGVPLRVRIPVATGNQVVSLAAALGLWDSNELGVPLLGRPPGMDAMCGASACYAATWRNAYRGFPFESGWSADVGGVEWRPILVTMLHGRSYADAERLLESALTAEAMASPTSEFLFMEGADPARGVLDTNYDGVITSLEALGMTATRVPFDTALTGRTLASFMTGTASLGDTIELNTYLPGSIVDNLTSVGAVPQNFRETGESQVSIARWVAMGVAGVHGTVAEPLNNCFPHRRLVVAYAEGATLAEAYHMNMPYTYWRNLVLGDPMAAPHATRPLVELSGVMDGERLGGAVPITVSASDALGRGVASVVAYVDGVEIARVDGDRLEHCLSVPAGDDHQLLLVARAAADPAEVHIWEPKGWLSVTLHSDSGSLECRPPDAGVVTDGGVLDAGLVDDPMSGGCSCRASRGADPRGGLHFGLAAVVLALGRRRRS